MIARFAGSVDKGRQDATTASAYFSPAREHTTVLVADSDGRPGGKHALVERQGHKRSHEWIWQSWQPEREKESPVDGDSAL